MRSRLNYSSAVFSVVDLGSAIDGWATCSGTTSRWVDAERPVAVRVGFVKCEYCATSQKRPDDGRCCACGGPTPHIDEAIYAR